MLNHGNIKTTLKYTHILDGEVAEAMEAVAQDRNPHSQTSSQPIVKKVG
jgi:hypothetical protein